MPSTFAENSPLPVYCEGGQLIPESLEETSNYSLKDILE